MRAMGAFIQKEIMELMRSGRMILLLIIFTMFGIMNPAMAKLTPWLYDMLADTMAEEGIAITNVTVDAMTSWNQYYKNVSIMVLVFALMFGGILANEYQKGTLIPILTKGLSRYQVLLAKFLTTLGVWSAVYWLSYGITYGYNAYYWDNSIGHHVAMGAACIYLFGCFVITLIMLASSFANNATGVLLLTGGVVIAIYLVSLIPTVTKYLPLRLLGAGDLVAGKATVADYGPAIGITIGLIVLLLAGAMLAIRRRQMSIQ